MSQNHAASATSTCTRPEPTTLKYGLCGANSLCGSTSIAIAKEPRDVALHLRWTQNAELSLDSGLVLHVVGSGPPYLNRSLLVYGVFDADNQHVQWRSRNQFPAMRNEQVTSYGLRRDFKIQVDFKMPAKYCTVAAQPVLAGWLGSIRSGRSSAGSASRRRSTTHETRNA